MRITGEMQKVVHTSRTTLASCIAVPLSGTHKSVEGQRRSGQRYYTWAELLRRAFGVEVLRCPRCGGARRLLAAIQDPDSIERVLRAMKLPFDAPELAPARAPPGGEQEWYGA